MIKFTHPRGYRQSKSYTRDINSKIISMPLSRATWWHADSLHIATLTDLYAELKQLEHQKDSFITLGELAPEAKIALANGKLVRRTGVKKTGQTPTVVDSPSRFVCFDIDTAEWAKGMSISEVIAKAINKALPKAFHDVSVIFQMSSSCLIKSQTILKCHLFFELTEPRTLQELKALDWWPKDIDGRLYIDRALFTLSQPIYTAKPKLRGITDPFLKNRTGFLKGSQSFVAIPKVKRSKRYDQSKPQKWAKMNMVTPNHDPGAKGALEKALLKLSMQSSERHNALLTTSCWLGRFISAGRLRESEVRDALRDACHLNGYIGKVSEREVFRVINDGIRHGAEQPLMRDVIFKASKHTSVQVVHTEQCEKDKSVQVVHTSQSEKDKSVQVVHTRGTEKIDVDLTPSSASQINNEVNRVLKVALSNNDDVKVIKLPTGAGKTRVALKLLAKENLKGKTIVYLVKNHNILAEVKDELSSVSNISPLILEGQSRNCQLYQTKANIRGVIDELRKEGIGIPKLCLELRCPFWDDCKTRKKEEHSLKGKFVIAAHAMLSHLKNLPTDSLLVIDESPKMIFTENMPINRLWSLVASPNEINESIHGNSLPALSKWRVSNYPTLGLFIKTLIQILEEESKVWMKRSQGYSLESESTRLIQLCKNIKPIAKSLLPGLDEIKLPRVKSDELARLVLSQSPSIKFKVARPSTLRMLKRVIHMICQDEESSIEDIRLVIGNDGSVVFERRTSLQIMKGINTWLLDATPNVDRWEALARNQNLSLSLIEGSHSSLKPHHIEGIWIKSNAYRSSRLFNDDSSLNDDALGALETVAKSLGDHSLTLDHKVTIGVGTHKRLASQIRSALSYVNQKSKQETAKPALADHPLIGELARFHNVKIGHTGRDNSASNQFSDCKLFVIIGSPRADMRCSNADSKTLNPHYDDQLLSEDYHRENVNALEQWFGRLRLLRRGDCKVIYAGDIAPPISVSVRWIQQDVFAGRPISVLATQLERIALDLLDKGMTVTKRLLIHLGATAKVARGIFTRLRAREEIMAKVHKHGRIILVKPCDHKVSSTVIFSGIKKVCDAVYNRFNAKNYIYAEKNSRCQNVLISDAGLQVTYASALKHQSTNALESHGWELAWLTNDLTRPKWFSDSLYKESNKPPDRSG